MFIPSCFRVIHVDAGRHTDLNALSSSSSDASNRLRTLSASSKDLGLVSSTGKLVARYSDHNDAASSSQVWRMNAYTTSAGRLAAWGGNQDTDLSTNMWNRVPGNTRIVDTDSEWHNDYQISEASDPYLDKVYSRL